MRRLLIAAAALLAGPAQAADYAQCQAMNQLLTDLYAKTLDAETRLRLEFSDSEYSNRSIREAWAKCGPMDEEAIIQKYRNMYPYDQIKATKAMLADQERLAYYECVENAARPIHARETLFVFEHPDYKAITKRFYDFEAKVKAAGCRP